jgi:hypothetical protein
MVEVFNKSMRKIFLLILLFLLIFENSTTQIYGESFDMQGQAEQSGDIEPFKRGGYRSPTRSYNPGVTNPGRTTPARPGNAVRNPTPPRTGFGGFFGGLFGGLALGAILGSLFNPFAGFSLGFPLLSLLSFALWLIVIFVVVRIIRRRKGY